VSNIDHFSAFLAYPVAFFIYDFQKDLLGQAATLQIDIYPIPSALICG
jgi:hypothetical protein